MKSVKKEYSGQVAEDQKISLSLSTVDSVGGNRKRLQLRGRDGEFLVRCSEFRGWKLELLHWSPREIRSLSAASIYRRRALD
jgi:hypothetical protein